MACVSNTTLQTLQAIGVDIATAKADAARHMDEQANMEGKVRPEWRCGANSTLVSSSAHVLSDNGAARVYACPNPGACIVRDDGTAFGTADCAAGYRGPLCGLCQEGHVWSEGHICKPCTGDTLAWLAGATVGACVVALIAYAIFLASPYFENKHGVGPGKRVLAWAAQRLARCRPAAAPPQHTASPSGRSPAPTLEPQPASEITSGRSEPASEPPRVASPTRTPEPVEAAQEIFEAFGGYFERLAETFAFTEEKEGAQARSLIGYLQVALRVRIVPPRLQRVHV